MAKKISTELKFWSKVNKNGPIHLVHGQCWIWTDSPDPMGYGRMWIDHPRRSLVNAHRVSWMINKGNIPENLWVLHKCDNPICVNPDHLFLGTHLDNMRDMISKGRGFRPLGELCGMAKLTEPEVIFILQWPYSFKGTLVQLAAHIGISKSGVDHIRAGHRWPHLYEKYHSSIVGNLLGVSDAS